MTGIIVLAAGSSSRLGKPKQNLLFEGHTLLQNAIYAAQKSSGNPVIVVLGAYQESIWYGIGQEGIKIVHNPDWEEGMASSIRTGLKTILKTNPHITQVIVMVCDQPFVTASLLNELIRKKSETEAIIACAYSDTFGTPVLFCQKFFDELLLLKGQEGAKKLLLKYKDCIETISFPSGAIDIDTLHDYESLVGKQHQKT